MKQCFGYIRVSTVKQGEGVSLPAQKEAIQAFAARNNIRITEWYEEKETAAKSGRPVCNAMVKALKAGLASGMVIHRIDRSSRNARDWATISDLADAGIDVHFATESLDFRSRGGRLTADIQAVIAADYIRNLSIEARKGIQGRLKQGFYPWPAPLGYLDNGSGKVKTIDPIRGPLVRELFALYLTGDYSIRTLHKEMVRRGLTTKGGRPVSKHTVEHILQNSFYCGLTRNGRTGELFDGIHEPLLSTAEFKRIADIRAGRYVKKKTKHNHLLRRLFWCEQCNTVLTPELQKQRVYYRCHTVGCTTKTVREDALDGAVRNGLKQLELPDKDDGALRSKQKQWQEGSNIEDNLQSLELRIANVEHRQDRLTDLLMDEKIEQEAFERKRAALKVELSALLEEREEINNHAATERDNEKFFELMKNLAGLYDSGTPGEKRALVENCFSNRSWNGKYVCLEPSDLTAWARDTQGVSYGGPIRDTIRTLLDMCAGDDRGQDIDSAA